MTLSVIIPTFDRQSDLGRLLASIQKNSRLPNEVVIIEQGDTQKTRHVIAQYASDIPVTIVAQEAKSLTRARNRGIANTSGDVVVFIDDDVEIAPDFFEVAHDYLLKNPAVLGVTGRDTLRHPPRTSLQYLKLFSHWLFCSAVLSGPSRVLRSGYNALQNFADHDQTVEWLSGCTQVWRRSVFQEGRRYNEHFVRWSLGEDALFSYQVHKAHFGSLRYVAALHFVHNQSETNRMDPPQIIRMRVIYRYIFWKKEVAHDSLFSTLCYLWSQVGVFGYGIVKARSVKTLHTWIAAYQYLFAHRAEIISENIDYNSFILND